jgi:hypothetical protein
MHQGCIRRLEARISLNPKRFRSFASTSAREIPVKYRKIKVSSQRSADAFAPNTRPICGIADIMGLMRC